MTTTPLSVTTIPNGPWRQNCYIVHKLKNALVIDPGSEAPRIIDHLKQNQLTPLAILNTHGHFDHIGAVSDIINYYHIPFYMHAKDKKLLARANMYKNIFGGEENISPPKNFEDLSIIKNGLKIGEFTIQILSTPGHTEGSVCFIIDDICMSGDTLFLSKIGRIDLPGGNQIKLNHSLKKLNSLETGIRFYPGHGKDCTLENIRENNNEFKLAVGLI